MNIFNTIPKLYEEIEAHIEILEIFLEEIYNSINENLYDSHTKLQDYCIYLHHCSGKFPYKGFEDYYTADLTPTNIPLFDNRGEVNVLFKKIDKVEKERIKIEAQKKSDLFKFNEIVSNFTLKLKIIIEKILLDIDCASEFEQLKQKKINIDTIFVSINTNHIFDEKTIHIEMLNYIKRFNVKLESNQELSTPFHVYLFAYLSWPYNELMGLHNYAYDLKNELYKFSRSLPFVLANLPNINLTINTEFKGVDNSISIGNDNVFEKQNSIGHNSTHKGGKIK